MDEHVMRTYARPDEVFVAGCGALLVDRDGAEYLDFLAGIAVSALGHGDAALRDALTDQVGRVIHVSNLFRHPYTEPVAASLCEFTGMDEVFFTNSGAEAIECALKLARRYHRARGEERTSFVALEGGFHGRTLGALSVTHAAKYREPFAPLLQAEWVPPEDEEALSRALAKRPAALLVEPIQGEGGVRALSDSFLRAARRRCDETGTLLVHDEVQSGCGRTGTFLAADHADVRPDVVCLAKPIAAGLPMGACLGSAKVAGTFQAGDHGSTFAGGPLVLRAASVFLDRLADGALLANVRERGQQLRDGLVALARDFPVVTEVRGRGLMLGMRMARGAADLQRALFRRRLIANCAAGDVIRLLPPFVITAEQIDDGLTRIRAALADLS